jgi:hypothetical protein
LPYSKRTRSERPILILHTCLIVQNSISSAFFTNARSVFSQSNRPICVLAIDAEEDFDWELPIQGTQHSTSHMRNIRTLHSILAVYGAIPTYLLTHPMLQDPDVVRIIRRELDNNRCAVGVQLHPWVTPPFDDMLTLNRSFAGNLAANLEEKKLIALKQKFNESFGFDPVVYRAGRYGLSRLTGGLLEKHGFRIDTSVAPRTSFAVQGGPDYTSYDCQPFWFGTQRDLLEIPLCRGVVGWAGALAPALYRRVSSPPLSQLHVPSILARFRCAERITLSPEGNDVAGMRRLVNGLHAKGQPVFALSFHSSSLQAGRNPYVQSKADLHNFYDRLSAILEYLAIDMSVQFASILQVPELLVAPARPGSGA